MIREIKEEFNPQDEKTQLERKKKSTNSNSEAAKKEIFIRQKGF